MNSFKTPKGTELPIMNIKGKPYLQVVHRLIWFREEHPDWGIKTTVKMLHEEAAVGYAEITDATGRIIATGHKYEDRKGFADFFEKCETSAIGRALALCGYGTQFATDLDEGDRLADSPVATTKPNPIAAAVIPTNRDKDAKGNNYISEKQLWRLFAIAKKHGLLIPAEVKAWLNAKFQIEYPAKILANQYDGIIRAIELIKVRDEPPPISGDDLPF